MTLVSLVKWNNIPTIIDEDYKNWVQEYVVVEVAIGSKSEKSAKRNG